MNLYGTRDDREVFGPNWCGPDTLPERAKTLIAAFMPEDKGGQAVYVYCAAFPARFYAVSALATLSRPAFVLETGSGSAEMARDIAEAIAEGMLSLVACERGGKLQDYA